MNSIPEESVASTELPVSEVEEEELEAEEDEEEEDEEETTLSPEKLAEMCGKCSGKCCKYYTVVLNEPEDAEDFDEMRWFLAHGDNYIYYDDDEWHLNVEARCKFLLDDGGCKIYHHRPTVCRDFGHNDECEFEGGYDFEMVFKTIPELEEYAKKVLPADELEKMHFFPKGYKVPE